MKAHTCHCLIVSNCAIMTHPDAGVQSALALLSEEVARYDDESGSHSRLELVSLRPDGGSFTSITMRARKFRVANWRWRGWYRLAVETSVTHTRQCMEIRWGYWYWLIPFGRRRLR